MSGLAAARRAPANLIPVGKGVSVAASPFGAAIVGGKRDYEQSFPWRKPQDAVFEPVGGTNADESEAGAREAYLAQLRDEVSDYYETEADASAPAGGAVNGIDRGDRMLGKHVAEEAAKEVARGVLDKKRGERDRAYDKCFKEWLLGKNKLLNNPVITKRGYTSYAQIFPGVTNWIEYQMDMVNAVRSYLHDLYMRGPSSEKEVEYEFRYLVWPLQDALRKVRGFRNDNSVPVDVLKGWKGGRWNPDTQTVNPGGELWPASLTYLSKGPDSDSELPAALQPALNPYMRDRWAASVTYEQWLAGDFSQLNGDLAELWEVAGDRIYGRDDANVDPFGEEGVDMFKRARDAAKITRRTGIRESQVSGARGGKMAEEQRGATCAKPRERQSATPAAPEVRASKAQRRLLPEAAERTPLAGQPARIKPEPPRPERRPIKTERPDEDDDDGDDDDGSETTTQTYASAIESMSSVIEKLSSVLSRISVPPRTEGLPPLPASDTGGGAGELVPLPGPGVAIPTPSEVTDLTDESELEIVPADKRERSQAESGNPAPKKEQKTRDEQDELDKELLRIEEEPRQSGAASDAGSMSTDQLSQQLVRWREALEQQFPDDAALEQLARSMSDIQEVISERQRNEKRERSEAESGNPADEKAQKANPPKHERSDEASGNPEPKKKQKAEEASETATAASDTSMAETSSGGSSTPPPRSPRPQRAAAAEAGERMRADAKAMAKAKADGPTETLRKLGRSIESVMTRMDDINQMRAASTTGETNEIKEMWKGIKEEINEVTAKQQYLGNAKDATHDDYNLTQGETFRAAENDFNEVYAEALDAIVKMAKFTVTQALSEEQRANAVRILAEMRAKKKSHATRQAVIES